MKIITVTNQKGGSGKTSTAALIARTLTAGGAAVLCLDADPQGGLTALLHTPEGPGLFEALTGETVIPLDADGLRVLRSDYRLDKIAYTLSPYELRDLIKQYAAEYCIIDTPPTVQGISRAAAIAAGLVIVPTDTAETSLGPLRYTLESLEKIERAGRVFLIGKEPREGAHGYQADLFAQFTDAAGEAFAGILPRTTTAQKAAAGRSRIPAAIQSIIGGVL